MLADMPVLSMLDRDVYLYAEVDRIVGLRSGTARRWINGYERSGRLYEPILRKEPRDTEWATWGEFVETRILAEYRDIAKVRTARLRQAINVLRKNYGVNYPLAYLQPYLQAESGEVTVGGSDLGLDEMRVVVRTGQGLLADGRAVIENAPLGSDEHGRRYVVEMPAADSFPGIVVNPNRYSGQPTFEGRRVAVATIAGMVAAGEREEDLAADYGLSLRQVRSAVDYVHKYGVAA
jgi:uncharacterized protein (DUF433 family)